MTETSPTFTSERRRPPRRWREWLAWKMRRRTRVIWQGETVYLRPLAHNAAVGAGVLRNGNLLVGPTMRAGATVRTHPDP